MKIIWWARIVAGLLIAITVSVFLSGANNFLYDALARVNAQPGDSRVVIVGIDQQSLQEIGRWPWNRNVFATFHRNLLEQNPSAIGYDILFLEETSNDQEFQSALELDDRVVIGSSLQRGALQQPIFENVDSGYTQVGAGDPGSVRSALLTQEIGGQCQPSFSLSLVLKYSQESVESCGRETILSDGQRLDNEVRFEVASGYDEISFKDILSGDFDFDLEGAVVLIGVTAPDVAGNVSDNIVTARSPQTPGVYVHAYMVDTLLNRDQFLRLPILASFLVLILLLSFSIIVTRNSFSKRHLAWYILMLLGVNLIGLAFYDGRYLFPFIEANIVIIVDGIIALTYWFLKNSTERTVLRNSFSRYVNPTLVNQIIDGQHNLELGGVETEIAILFFDIRGFTSISEKYTPDKVVSLLNTVFETTSQIVLENDGFVDKYIGDAMMAFWNAPVAVEDYETKSVDSAYKMAHAVKRIQFEGEEVDLGIGVGLHKGIATVGNIGSSKLLNYTIIGDSVNVASRIESLTKHYGVRILISQSIYKKYAGILDFLEIDTVVVKGKKRPEKLYLPYSGDGIESEIIEKYSSALGLYYSGQFKEALKIFQEISNFGPAKVLIKRIKSNEIDTASWKGVWKMDHK